MKVMKVTGQITLWDVEFVFVVDGENILLIPKEKEDIKKVNSHFYDSNFVVNYCPDVWQATAFIERVEYGTNGAIKLYPKYIIDQCHKNLFAGFEITGEAIDDFFSPSRYFFDRRKKDTEESVDFIYHSEIADKWTVTFEDRPITITLSYGDILRWGIASDLMLHPKLTVDFEKTADTEYVYEGRLVHFQSLVYILPYAFLVFIASRATKRGVADECVSRIIHVPLFFLCHQDTSQVIRPSIPAIHVPGPARISDRLCFQTQLVCCRHRASVNRSYTITNSNDLPAFVFFNLMPMQKAGWLAVQIAPFLQRVLNTGNKRPAAVFARSLRNTIEFIPLLFAFCN